ncbi:PWI domain-containing protein [Lindgomyces ingoldianus]|uniref:PWI domain-containing protein n=1 Tax=Lindgomyces ingoldianus TaxID=673940 RepID=A0ACB6QKY4_9PLEO|nr:PWI domain-containing protein [Lindgomyces ingoldianus]KAF2467565.1 PWI domain-containing protein [Lindgomyces ingoldianus]
MALSVDQKRLKATKFPPEFDQKVDTLKVNVDLLKKWIASKITGILGDEDDVVIDTCFNLLEESQFPNIKAIQIQLMGFLGKDCPAFCRELWTLMLSAQESPRGVPKELLEAKKLEMKQEQASKAAAESRRQQEREQNEMIDSFRRDERVDRGDRGRGRGFRDRPGRARDFNRRPPRRDSRSPPPRSPPYAIIRPSGKKSADLRHRRRRRVSPPPRRERDIYIPRGRGRDRDRAWERRSSPSLSRSRSPPRRRAEQHLLQGPDLYLSVTTESTRGETDHHLLAVEVAVKPNAVESHGNTSLDPSPPKRNLAHHPEGHLLTLLHVVEAMSIVRVRVHVYGP